MAAVATKGPSVGVPVKLFREAESHNVTVELKSGEVYRGTLEESEESMSCLLKNVSHTSRDGRVVRMEAVYLRGSQIRFVVLPEMLKGAPLFQCVCLFTAPPPLVLLVLTQRACTVPFLMLGFFPAADPGLHAHAQATQPFPYFILLSPLHHTCTTTRGTHFFGHAGRSGSLQRLEQSPYPLVGVAGVEGVAAGAGAEAEAGGYSLQQVSLGGFSPANRRSWVFTIIFLTHTFPRSFPPFPACAGTK